MKIKKDKQLWIIAFSVILTLIIAITDCFSSTDNNIQDSVFMSSSSIIPINRPVSDKIIIVGIDEYSTSSIGRWPWQRSVLAQGIEKLENLGVAAIGLDITLSDNTDEENDRKLVETVKKYGNIVAPSYVEYSEYDSTFVHPFDDLKNVCINAHINTYPENKVIRQTINTVDTGQGTLNSFAIELYKEYCKKTGKKCDNVDKFIKNQTDDARSYFDYQGGKDDTFCYVSFADLLKEDYPEDYFKQCIVLIGPCAPSLKDEYYTPLDKNEATYGVVIWAYILQNLINGNSIKTVSCMDTSAIIVIGILLGLAFMKMRPIKGFAVLACADILIIAAARLLYANEIRVSIIYLLIVSWIVYFALFAYKYIMEYKEKKRVKNIFGKYVAPQVVSKILDEGEEGLKLGGSRRFITVLFVDIRGFTSMSEKVDPEKVVEILNAYLNLCATSIMENDGMLDKFVGDAAMAIFNAPIEDEEHAVKAVKAAAAMKKGSLELEKKLMEKFGHSVKFGIGINTGYAVVGNTGCKFRMDYTAIGDTVNTAARLESSAKPGQILISQSTYDLVKDKVEAEQLGEISVKGKETKIQIYEIEEMK